MEKIDLECPYCGVGGNSRHAPIPLMEKNFSIILQVATEPTMLICFQCGNAGFYKGVSLLERIPAQRLDYLKTLHPQIIAPIEGIKNMIVRYMAMKLITYTERNRISLPTDPPIIDTKVPGLRRYIQPWNSPKHSSI